jgi:hypothetical protein
MVNRNKLAKAKPPARGRGNPFKVYERTEIAVRAVRLQYESPTTCARWVGRGACFAPFRSPITGVASTL